MSFTPSTHSTIVYKWSSQIHYNWICWLNRPACGVQPLELKPKWWIIASTFTSMLKPASISVCRVIESNQFQLGGQAETQGSRTTDRVTIQRFIWNVAGSKIDVTMSRVWLHTRGSLCITQAFCCNTLYMPCSFSYQSVTNPARIWNILLCSHCAIIPLIPATMRLNSLYLFCQL